jgi:hypothetical protein
MESMTTSQYLIVPSTPMTTNTPGLQVCLNRNFWFEKISYCKRDTKIFVQ